MEITQKKFAFGSFIAALTIGFASAFLTAKMFYESTEGVLRFIYILIGCCFDFGKYAFSSLAIWEYKKNNYAGAIIATLFAIIAVIISFGASQTYTLNNNNKILNETVANSTVKERNDTRFETTQKMIDIDTKELNNLTANKQEIINKYVNDLVQQRDSLPENYITKKSMLSKEIENKKSKKEIEIDNKIALLKENINNNNVNLEKIDNEFKKEKKEIKTTRGMYSLASWMGTEKTAEKTFEKMMMIFNIVLEMFGIAFSLAFTLFLGKNTSEKNIVKATKNFISGFINNKKEKLQTVNGVQTCNNEINSQEPGKKKDNNYLEKDNITNSSYNEIKSLNTAKTKDCIDTQQNKMHKLEIGSTQQKHINTRDEIKTKRKIGFDINNIEKETDKYLEKYLKILYDKNTWHNGFPRGYTWIAKELQINNTLAQKVRGQLERMDIISTEKIGAITRSKINITYTQALRKIQKLI